MGTLLPVIVSVPHGGSSIPPEVAGRCRLSTLDLAYDGDTWARELYACRDRVVGFLDTSVPRAVLDMNRSADDRPPANPDGVVKTVTVQGQQVWDDPAGLARPLVDRLIARYHVPYHARLEQLAQLPGVVLGLDCHTMLATGPPVGPDPNSRRPLVCLGHRGGRTAPTGMVTALREALIRELDTTPHQVTIDVPFKGGYIIHRHGRGRAPPWIQLELSRELYLPGGRVTNPEPDEKCLRHLSCLRNKILRAVAQVL